MPKITGTNKLCCPWWSAEKKRDTNLLESLLLAFHIKKSCICSLL